MFFFAHGEYLLLCLGTIILGLFFINTARSKKKVRKKMGAVSFVNFFLRYSSHRKFVYKFCLALIAFDLLVFSFADLRHNSDSTTETPGVDVIFAVDVSNSMLSKDSGQQRLKTAKQAAITLVRQFENVRAGLLFFAGEASLQVPLTYDTTEMIASLDNISTDVLSVEGTNILSALKSCRKLLQTFENRQKLIVLLSDGGNNKEGFTVEKQVDLRAIPVFSIGIGTVEGAALLVNRAGDYKKDNTGSIIISRLNDSLLKTVAADSDGKYFQLSKTANLAEAITGEIKKLQFSAQLDEKMTRQTPYYWIFGLLAAGLLIAEVRISATKKLNVE